MQEQIKLAMGVRRLVILVAFALLAMIMVREAYMLLADARTNGDIGEDFKYYYTAAWMVRNHQSQAIYSDIWKDADPTEDGPGPNSVFARTANALGITEVFSYVYPPTLADLLVPFTLLSISTALYAWWVLNIAALIGSGVLFAYTAGQELSSYVAPFIVFLFVSTPTVDCLKCGQVLVLLLFFNRLWDQPVCKGEQIRRRTVFCAGGSHQTHAHNCCGSLDCLGRLEGFARYCTVVRCYRWPTAGCQRLGSLGTVFLPCFAIAWK
jgi:hypothetical protein